MRYKYWLCVLFFYLVSNVSAQSPVFKNFTINDGLPSNETYSIFQDSKGFVWICTDAGLVKYDANKFRTFSSLDGMPDNTVFEVKEDKKGRIWFRTFSGNIGYVLNDSVYTIPANDAIIEFQKGGIICSIAIDDELNVYVGRQSPEKICFLKIAPPYKTNDLDTIFRNPTTNSWIDIIVFHNNDFVYSEKRWALDQYVMQIRFLNPEQQVILIDSTDYTKASAALTRMDRAKDYFVLANDHLLKEYSLKDKTIKTKYVEHGIINVYIKKAGNLFLSYRDKGIQTYLGEWNNSQAGYLSTLSNSEVMEDNKGGIWHSTLKNGVFYSNNQSYQAFDVSNNTYKSILFMRPISEDGLVVGLEGGGCLLYKLEKGHIQFVADMGKGLEGDYKIRNVMDLGGGKLFASYAEKSLLYDVDKLIPIKNTKSDAFKISFTDLFFYKNGIIGYAYNHATTMDSVDFSIKSTITAKDRFTAFASNPKTGEAYFGAIHGLYKYYGQQQLTDKDKLYSFRIKDIDFLNDRLFIATKGFGLIVKSGSVLDTIGVSNGLLGNVCEKIVIQGNKCWVSSNKGLSCVSYSGYKKYTIVNYPLKDLGTPSLIQDYFFKDSVLYFASGNRVYSYPLEETGNVAIPFYIYSVEINNKPVSGKSNLDLNYDEANIKVHFGALHYNLGGKVHYRYKLLPNDQDWIYTTESSILFPSLSTGSYSLVLQAQKYNGSWIECKETVSFTINQPFWSKWWFIVILVFCGFAIASYITYFLYNKKVERILLKNKIRSRLYNLEIKAMKAQMNPHFIFNSLNAIQQFILTEENENAYKYLSKFSKLVRKLLESNESESLSVESEVDILNKYLEIEALRFKDSFTYKIVLDPNLIVYQRIPHMMIQPFVENAIWHGLLHKTGNRELCITFMQVDQKRIACVIDDNGVGIKKSMEKPASDSRARSLALEFIRERLVLFSKTLGGSYTLQIKDKSDANATETGTVVKIVLPIMEELKGANKF